MLRVILASSLFVPCFGCYDPFYRGTRAGGDSVPGSVSYQSDVYPILVSYCSACHSATGAALNTHLVLTLVPLNDYNMVTELVDTNSPQDSQLLVKAAGIKAHSGGATLSQNSVEFKTLQAWVEQGAAND